MLKRAYQQSVLSGQLPVELVMADLRHRDAPASTRFTAGVFAVPAFLTGVHVQRQKTLRERKKLWRETHPRRRSLVWEDRAAPLLIKRDDGMALEKRVPPPLETIFRVHEPVAQLFPSARQHELEAIEHAQGRSKKIKQGLKVAGAVGIAGGGTALAYWAGTRLAYMPKSEMERYNQSQEP
ncbi:hypothetical protein IE81DRAFT_124692 [Ceraceosorus guamensis]|uniref:Uncharacterized protein n=1 Tax=Ceraceosorus guamensis TaxID=1522189 RepID=A0A316VYG3_9BASI|nr:hypothetical protein IE81DRAFT_124692 [Ceraceosorus guamensis]PWN42489.1 hypothetical protein IE81DRAFT_124692 [Ceraceosorus guamensis]